MINQEAKRKQKEEEELRKKKERDSKKAEVDKMQNAGKPNFVISKRTGSSGDEVSSSKITLLNSIPSLELHASRCLLV
jgi:hypothetical protein